MLKYFKNISLRLFFILLGLLILLTALALIRNDEHIRLLIALSLAVLSALAWWLARSINRITRYAEAMAQNRPVQAPYFGDSYLYRLVSAIQYLRDELNHKQQIENYVLGLTHELKTPLTAQQAALELLQDDAISSEQQQLIERIERNIQKQQQLIERLLQLARLENREQLEYPQSLSLQNILTQAMQDCSAALDKKRLKILQLETINNEITGDSFLIRQAIDNLLYNAIDFANENSIITIRLSSYREMIKLQIYNEGVSIPDYALNKIPQRFYSLPRANGQKSSGLGLNFVQEIMRLHCGVLQINNHDNGVCVSLIFSKNDF